MSKVVSKPAGTAVSLQTAFSILNQKINGLEAKHSAMFTSVERKIGQQDTFVNKIDTDQINSAISEIVDRMLGLLERVDHLEKRVEQLEGDEKPRVKSEVLKPETRETRPEPRAEARAEARVEARAEPKVEAKKKRGTVKLEELDSSIGISFSN
jgi:hypothetical protein